MSFLTKRDEVPARVCSMHRAVNFSMLARDLVQLIAPDANAKTMCARSKLGVFGRWELRARPALGGIDALVLTGALAKMRFPSALEYPLALVGWASTWMSRPTQRADRALAVQAAVFPPGLCARMRNS